MRLIQRTTLKCCGVDSRQVDQPGESQMGFDLWNFLGGLLTGTLGGALLTLKLTKNIHADRHGTATDQSRARAGGDIVGRDKH